MKSKGAILVVDDTLASLKLLTEILTAEGYEIHPADSGELALASVASNPPEVILLDIRMPGMDGFEVCRRLKARPESREIPVLFISATTDQAERVEGLRLGAVDFIAKPFQREDLLARVAIHLELARLRTQLETQVAQRTAELTLANEQLKNELEERKRAEENLMAAKLSAERAKEAAEDASRAKDRFLAILSHELRTPLTPVLALTSALREDKSLGGALHKDLQTIQRNVELEARLIDDLIDVTRIVHGKIKLDKLPVDLSEIIRRVVEICRADLKVRRIHFGVKTEGEPYPVLVDDTRLQQVFWNLLRNALKFTPEDGCIGIECRRVGQSVVAEVKDSGKGIAAEDLGRIFNPFEQIERKESGAYGGLGLGLTLSKSLVELHGGTIEAKSEGLEHGATFSVTLPLAEAVVPVVTSPAGPSAPASLRSLRILLVEDHGDTARILSRLLRNQGHEVRTAGDLKHALELSREWEFDLLISDLGLPDGNGRDIISQLRSIRPQIPGIAISGFGTEEDIHLSLEAGFEEHLVKPVSIAALREAIQRIASKAAI